MKTLPLAAVRTDGGTQPRAELSEELIEEYAAALVEGAAFPPVIVFHSGEDHWLADGFHRLEAHRRAGCLDIAADVRKGTLREAVLFSAGANADHGLRRTNEDKRRAVEKLLSDEEWAAWSDREIARRCAVDHKTVGGLRAGLSGEVPQMERRAERNGTVYTINTERIGASPPQPCQPREVVVEGEPEAVERLCAAVIADAHERVTQAPRALEVQAPLVQMRDPADDYVPVPVEQRDEQIRQIKEKLRDLPDWAKAQDIESHLVELAEMDFTGGQFRTTILPRGLEKTLGAIPRVRQLLDEIEEVKTP